MLSDILNLNLFAFMLIFARMGTALAVMPGFGSEFINIRMRLIFALAVSFIMTPVLATVLPRMPETVPGLVVLVGYEMIIGVFFGMIMRTLTSALQVAGTLISYFASMANAFIQDPISEQQSSMLATFMGITALTLIFVMGLHHLMIRSVAESYVLFPPGQELMIGDKVDFLARTVMDSFTIGVKMSAPFMVVVLAYYLGLGILGRLMPQMPVFFVGMPIQIMLQLLILITVLSAIMMLFTSFYRDTLSPFVSG